MTDREKTIKELEECLAASCRGFRMCPYSDVPDWDAVREALALLKEQESVVAIVRCKDCIYRPTAVKGRHETYYDFPYEGKCPCQCDDDWYSWMPDDDWFCADGVRGVSGDD